MNKRKKLKPYPIHIANNPYATDNTKRVALEMEQRRGRTMEEILKPGDEVRTVIYNEDEVVFEEVYMVTDWFGAYDLTYLGVYEL